MPTQPISIQSSPGSDRESGHRLIANLDSAQLAAGREFRHHRVIRVAAQRYPTDLLRLVGAREIRAGRLAGVMPRFTNRFERC